MKKIYLLKKEADGSVSTLGEYDSTQAASNAAMVVYLLMKKLVRR